MSLLDDRLRDALLEMEAHAPTSSPPALSARPPPRRALPLIAAAAVAILGIAVYFGVTLNERIGAPSQSPTPSESRSLHPSPTAPSSDGPNAPPVPQLTASNGSNGTPVSWCWDGACIDGSLDFEDPGRYPGVGGFFSVASDRAVTRLDVTAFVSADDFRQVDLMSDNEILVSSPEFRLVLVHAEFADGGEASYAWRLVRNVIVGVGDDHVVITEPLIEVTPPSSPDDAAVHVAYEDWELLGIEGAALFLKATTQRGAVVVLDRINTHEGSTERLPPGNYVLTAYYRTCDGSCDLLDPAKPLCSVDAVLAPNQTIQLTVSVSGRACEAGAQD